MVRYAWRRVRRFACLLRWGSGALARPMFHAGEQRRALIVYDFSSQPFSIGDILIFQEASLVLRERHRLGKVDFALVYNPVSPVVPDPAFKKIDAESFLVHISSALPAAQVNPYLGSVFLFDSHRQLEQYIADNQDEYFVWPTLGLYASQDYLFYHCFNELFREHFEQHGQLPALGSRPATREWARAFVAQHVGHAVAVTVQLRRNLANPPRNSNIDVWIAFFSYCIDKYNAKFIVICGRNEIDERLRTITNVILAKDHGTGIEQDLALIEAADLHMGMASGPGTMAHFGRKPYCMFKWDLKPGTLKNIVRDDYRHRFQFSTPLQSWIYESENEALLKVEFQRLWDGRPSGATASC